MATVIASPAIAAAAQRSKPVVDFRFAHVSSRHVDVPFTPAGSVTIPSVSAPASFMMAMISTTSL